jgi:hypothetical protein
MTGGYWSNVYCSGCDISECMVCNPEKRKCTQCMKHIPEWKSNTPCPECGWRPFSKYDMTFDDVPSGNPSAHFEAPEYGGVQR